MPLVERLAKSARRTFIGDRVWSARVELDELYAKNDLQHRAIREAIAAGSAAGARLLAREHVLSSGRLIEIVIESLGERRPRPRVGRVSAGRARLASRRYGEREVRRDVAHARGTDQVRSVADALRGRGAERPSGRGGGRPTTVVRPSCFAGHVVVDRGSGAAWRMRSRGTSIVSNASSNGARLGLYARASSAVTIQSKRDAERGGSRARRGRGRSS